MNGQTVEALTAVRAQLAKLVAEVDGALPRPLPSRRFTTSDQPRWGQEHGKYSGWLWEVPDAGGRVWSVRTAEDTAEDLTCVYVVSPSTWPEGDTDALSVDAARAFALALLAACDRPAQVLAERVAS